MASLLDIDELNKLGFPPADSSSAEEYRKAVLAQEDERIFNLRAQYLGKFADIIRGKKEDIWSDIYLYLFWDYLCGKGAFNDEIEIKYADIEKYEREFAEILAKEVEGKTARDRVLEYADNGDVEAIVKVMRTEGNRLYNAGVASMAEGNAKKIWHTMLDDKVRDTHNYLEGMTIDFSDAFYTYDGDYALYPGDFALVENNVNCRCYITIED